MHVAYVSDVVYPYVTGGAERRIYEIGRRLVDRGHDVTVYCRKFWDGDRRTREAGMTYVGVSSAGERYSGRRRSITDAVAFTVAVLPTLRRRAADHDVVVASVFPYFPVFAASVGVLGVDVPLVTTWHEVWRDYWRDYLGRPGVFGRTVERAVAALPQVPVAVSEQTADRLAGLGVGRDRIAVVPGGVDVDRIRDTPPATDGYDVLFAGRLIHEKGVDVLLEAFNRVAAVRDVRLGIVGDGPEREALEATAASLDSDDRIDFLGFLADDRDVVAQMRAADVFASLSTREGFGITVLEAAAAGCRLVAADAPRSAVDEILGPEDFLVDPTPTAAAAALDGALAAGPPRDRPGVARYDWDRVADRAATVYRDAT